MSEKKPKDTRCSRCRFYLELPAPFHYEKDGYPDGVTVYGFCTKDTVRRSTFYPVYLPDGGACDAFKSMTRQSKQADSPVDGQMCMEV